MILILWYKHWLSTCLTWVSWILILKAYWWWIAHKCEWICSHSYASEFFIFPTFDSIGWLFCRKFKWIVNVWVSTASLFYAFIVFGKYWHDSIITAHCIINKITYHFFWVDVFHDCKSFHRFINFYAAWIFASFVFKMNTKSICALFKYHRSCCVCKHHFGCMKILWCNSYETKEIF